MFPLPISWTRRWLLAPCSCSCVHHIPFPSKSYTNLISGILQILGWYCFPGRIFDSLPGGYCMDSELKARHRWGSSRETRPQWGLTVWIPTRNSRYSGMLSALSMRSSHPCGRVYGNDLRGSGVGFSRPGQACTKRVWVTVPPPLLEGEGSHHALKEHHWGYPLLLWELWIWVISNIQRGATFWSSLFPSLFGLVLSTLEVVPMREKPGVLTACDCFPVPCQAPQKHCRGIRSIQTHKYREKSKGDNWRRKLSMYFRKLECGEENGNWSDKVETVAT